MYIINTRVVTKCAKQRGITNKLKVKIECLKYSNDLKEAGKEQQGKEQIWQIENKFYNNGYKHKYIIILLKGSYHPI